MLDINSVLDDTTALRKKLLRAGFTPLPTCGKRPFLNDWNKVLVDDAAIEAWRSRPGESNTGIRTTDAPTIDIDISDAGVADEAELVVWECLGLENGKILRRTGRAPRRAILCKTMTPFKKKATRAFKSPDGEEHKVEILAEGEQVIAFGIHPITKRPYTWDNGGEPGDVTWDELPLLTEPVADEIIKRTTEVLRAQPDWIEQRPKEPPQRPRDGLRRILSEPSFGEVEDALSYIPNDLDYDSWIDMGFAIAAALGDAGQPLWEEFSLRYPDHVARDIQRKWPSFLKLGGIKAATLFWRARHHGWKPAYKKATIHVADTAHQEDNTAHEEEAESRPFTPLGEWDAGLDHTIPPPRCWLLGNVFCRQFASSLFADGAVGKTSVRYTQFLSLAINRSLTGEHVFGRRRVLVISLEDGAEELRRRILAARIHHGVELEDIKGWLYLAAPGLEDGERLLEVDQKGRLVVGGLAERIEEAIVRLKIDIIGLDPLVKLHAVGENDNTSMDKVAQILTKLAIKYNIAVDVPHHNSKGPPEPGNAKRGRGASSTKDAFRLVYTLTPMVKEDAEGFGLGEDERKYLVRMDSGKVNIAPPAETAIWFRLVGVNIGNGNDEYPQGDNVQTVERWNPPALFADITIKQINDILDDIDRGLPDGNRYSDHGKAGDRAVWQVVIKHTHKLTEEQAKKVISVWRQSGLLFVKDYTHPKRKESTKGLWVDNTKRPG